MLQLLHFGGCGCFELPGWFLYICFDYLFALSGCGKRVAVLSPRAACDTVMLHHAGVSERRTVGAVRVGAPSFSGCRFSASLWPCCDLPTSPLLVSRLVSTRALQSGIASPYEYNYEGWNRC